MKIYVCDICKKRIKKPYKLRVLFQSFVYDKKTKKLKFTTIKSYQLKLDFCKNCTKKFIDKINIYL
jgi:uncharacterized protein YlaI